MVLFRKAQFLSWVENGQFVVGHSVGFYFQCCVYDEWQPGRNYANNFGLKAQGSYETNDWTSISWGTAVNKAKNSRVQSMNGQISSVGSKPTFWQVEPSFLIRWAEPSFFQKRRAEPSRAFRFQNRAKPSFWFSKIELFSIIFSWFF